MYATNPIIGLIYIVLDVYKWIVIAAVIMSWLIAFNVINTRNQFVYSVMRFLVALTEPVFAPIRRILPVMGGIDLSPLVVFFAIVWIEGWVLPWIVVHFGLY